MSGKGNGIAKKLEISSQKAVVLVPPSKRK
jgi:hypothetical protein